MKRDVPRADSTEGSETSDKPWTWIVDTRPLLNFTSTGSVALLTSLLGARIWVPAEVHGQWRQAVSTLDRKLKATAVSRHDPADVRLLRAFQSTKHRFNGNPFRVTALHGKELELAVQLKRDHQEVDSGEAEALAMCICRGAKWAVVLDDRPARSFALGNRIHTIGTLDLLVSAVREGHCDLSTGEELLSVMKHGWPRAPIGQLAEYLNGGRPIWTGE